MKTQHNRIFIIAICFFMIAYGVRGQNLKQKGDSLVHYKWDASLDVLNLFSGFREVMIRYGSSPRGAVRFSIGNLGQTTKEQFQYYDSTGIISKPLYDKSKGFNLRAQLGYEWRKNYGRHQLYYGTDASIYYNWGREYVVTLYPANEYAVGIRPFVGLKYRVFNRLSISAEAYFSADYRVAKIFGPQRTVTLKSKTYGFAVGPLRLINLSYHF